MANKDTPMGFVPAQELQPGSVRWFTLADSNAILAVGDLAVLTSDGKVNRWYASSTGDRAATDEGPCLGVVVGIKVVGAGPNTVSDGLPGDRSYIAASATSGTVKVGVCVDPDMTYVCQHNNGVYISESTIGLVGDITVTAATSLGNGHGRSNFEVDALTDGTADTAYMVKVVGLRNAIGDVYSSTSTGEFAKMIVKLNYLQQDTLAGIPGAGTPDKPGV